jgi:hypothetical protein
MTTDAEANDARALWQDQPPVLPDGEIRLRTEQMRAGWDGTQWVPPASAALLAVCFLLILNNAATVLQAAGSVLGLAAAGYVVVRARRLGRSRAPFEGAPCVRAYRELLLRQRDAFRVSVVAIALSMAGATLASTPAAWGAARAWLGAVGTAVSGAVTVVYLLRQLRIHDEQVREVSRLE